METLKFKIPLLMFSDTEVDPNNKNSCLIRNMCDLNICEVNGVERLLGQYCWIRNYYKWDCGNVDEMLQYDKRCYGFNINDVIMEVTFDNGYYIIDLLSNLPLSTIVSYHNGYGEAFKKEVTLKEAIIDFLDGCLSDGIGENPIGKVVYNHTTHDVWLGKLIEI